VSIGRDPVAIRFGKNLRSLRERAEISQAVLGLRASLHRTEIGLLERGERVPRIDTLIKLTSALSVPPGALLKGINWKRRGFHPGAFELNDPG
jgi:transcriptional regulator with XRE-family HTH domain